MTAIPDHVPDDLHQPAAAPAYTQDELLEFSRVGHTFDNPESTLRRIEMGVMAVRMRRTFCQHCRPDYRLRPMAGAAWGIEWFHADGCPDGDDA